MPSYSLTLGNRFTAHYHHKQLTVNDYAEKRDPRLDALARSGDYFVTLATRLENIAADLPLTSTATSSLALIRLATELDYLQRYYNLQAKSQPDRLIDL